MRKLESLSYPDLNKMKNQQKRKLKSSQKHLKKIKQKRIENNMQIIRADKTNRGSLHFVDFIKLVD